MWLRPVNFVANVNWTNHENSYDGDTASGASTSTAKDFLELVLPYPVYASRVRAFVGTGGQDIAIDVYNGSWVQVTDYVTIGDGSWVIYNIPGGPFNITRIRAALDFVSGSRDLFELQVDGDDPFTYVLRQIWAALEDQPEFTELVPAGNRIKLYEGTSDPNKYTFSIADMPFVKIEAAGGAINMAVDSTTAKITQIYSLVGVGGDLRINKHYFPLKWAILKALASHDDYFSVDYVRRVVLTDYVMSSNVEIEGHPGYAGGFDIAAELWLNRDYLKA